MFIYLPGPSAGQEGRRAKGSPVGCYTISDGFEDNPTRLTTSDVGLGVDQRKTQGSSMLVVRVNGRN